MGNPALRSNNRAASLRLEGCDQRLVEQRRRIPWPSVTIVGPHELEGANPWAEESGRALEVDVRVLDLNHFEKKLALMIDMAPGRSAKSPSTM